MSKTHLIPAPAEEKPRKQRHLAKPPQDVLDKMRYFFEHRLGVKLSFSPSHGPGIDFPDDTLVLEDYIDEHSGARITHSVDIEDLAAVLFLDAATNKGFMENTVTQEECDVLFRQPGQNSPAILETSSIDWNLLLAGDPDGDAGYKRYFELWKQEAETEQGIKPGPPAGTTKGKWHREMLTPPAHQPKDDGPKNNALLKARGRVTT